MNGIRSFAFLFALLITLPVTAQDTLNARPNHLKGYGKTADRMGDYYSAIDFYHAYCLQRPADHKATFRLAELYRLSRDYKRARTWYINAYNGNPDKYTLALYYYARMTMACKDYETAIKRFEDFRKEYRGKKDHTIYRKLAKQHISGCQLAMSKDAGHNNIRITHLDTSINRANMESAPYLADSNMLIYAAVHLDTMLYFNPNDSSALQVPKGRLYLARQKEGRWVHRGSLSGPFNDDDYHVGNVVMSPDQNRMFFTRCRKNWKNEMICGIYESRFENNAWTTPEPLPKEINHPRYTATQVSIGIDPRKQQTILYFASNRPGGKGGMDLWYVVESKRGFGQPRNCGSKVNTAEDEVTPHFDQLTQSLYFSSAGKPGFGELDVFRALGSKSKWNSEVTNLGAPVNSEADDLYYHLAPDRKSGFFTSNRIGSIALKHPTCCDDIYSFDILDYIEVTFEALITDGEKQLPLQDAQLSLFYKDPNNGDTLFLNQFSTSTNGKISTRLESNLTYYLEVAKDRYFTANLEINTNGLSKSATLNQDIALQPITDQAIVLEDIYYDFDDWKLNDLARKTVDSTLLNLLLINPDIKVEISSHTDSKGSGAYNLKLSQKRADAVVDYLIDRGIERKRMIAKGYGMNNPIAPNNHPDGSDNPEGRKVNRRTEFKVIGYLK